MTIGIQQARPPFVRFVREAVKDTPATLEAGRLMMKDVDFVYIRQQGSKDEFKCKTVDWLADIKRKGLEGTHDAYPMDWVDGFHRGYEAWKNGQEGPIQGTSVKEWAVLTPAQAQNFISMGVVAIEDVANMTEEAMLRFGMDARKLKEAAKEWMAGKDISKNYKEENEALRQQLEELQAQVAQLMESRPKTPGRKPRLAKAA